MLFLLMNTHGEHNLSHLFSIALGFNNNVLCFVSNYIYQADRLPFVQYGKIYGYVYWRFSLYDVEGGGCGGGCGCGAVSGGHFE